MVQLSQPYVTPGKTIALNIWTFVGRVMSLLFNTLSRFVIAPLPKKPVVFWFHGCSHHLQLFLEPKKRKSVATSTIFPSLYHESMGPDAMILDFLIFSLQLALSLSSFIMRLFSSSSLSPIRVVSQISAHLRLLMFPLPILIPACNSSSPAFLMMCSAYRLNKQGDIRQPSHTPFSILNQPIVPFRVLTVASWPEYRFLR